MLNFKCNILNGLVFFYGLKSRELEILTDQRLTEVTFGVTFKSNDAQLC